MVQIVKQSHEEKVAMYMELPKLEIIEMLIESNRQMSKVIKPIVILEKDILQGSIYRLGSKEGFV